MSSGENTAYASMCSLASRLTASRAGLAGFAFLSFECEKRRVRSLQLLPTGQSSAKKSGAKAACGTDRFSRSIIRVACLLDAVLPQPYTKIIQSF